MGMDDFIADDPEVGEREYAELLSQYLALVDRVMGLELWVADSSSYWDTGALYRCIACGARASSLQLEHAGVTEDERKLHKPTCIYNHVRETGPVDGSA